MTDSKHDSKNDKSTAKQAASAKVKATSNLLSALRQEAAELPAKLESLGVSTDVQAVRDAHVRNQTIQADLRIAEMQYWAAKIAEHEAQDAELKAAKQEVGARLSEALEVEQMAKAKREAIGGENYALQHQMLANSQSIGTARQNIERLKAELGRLKLSA